MPPELAALADASGGRLVVALVDDLGPATKLAPTLRRERGAGTILLWADDDHLYAPWCGERARDPREYIYTPENDPLEPPPPSSFRWARELSRHCRPAAPGAPAVAAAVSAFAVAQNDRACWKWETLAAHGEEADVLEARERSLPPRNVDGPL